jgi:hypothetical protein
LDFELLDAHKEKLAHEGDEVDSCDEDAHEKARKRNEDADGEREEKERQREVSHEGAAPHAALQVGKQQERLQGI